MNFEFSIFCKLVIVAVVVAAATVVQTPADSVHQSVETSAVAAGTSSAAERRMVHNIPSENKIDKFLPVKITFSIFDVKV